MKIFLVFTLALLGFACASKRIPTSDGPSIDESWQVIVRTGTNSFIYESGAWFILDDFGGIEL